MANINMMNMFGMSGLSNMGFGFDARALAAATPGMTSEGLGLISGDMLSTSLAASLRDPNAVATFAQTFDQSTIADMLGLDASKLTDQQTQDLTNLLFDINEENGRREMMGQAPMTKEEVNEYIKNAVSDYQKDPTNTNNSLGKTLNELGMADGMTDTQYNNMMNALNSYNNKLAEDMAKQMQNAQEAQDAGNCGGGGGGGGANGVGGAGSSSPNTSGTNGTGANNGTASTDNFPEDLEALQNLKAETETTIGNLKNQVDDKQAEINERQAEIVKETLGEELEAQNAELMEEYEAAQADFQTASDAKEKAQNEVSQCSIEASQNDQKLYANAQARQQNESELSSAQSELSSLTPPTPPAGDDEDGSAQAAYQQELAAYNAKKAELEAKIQRLETEKAKLEDEYQQLENEKDAINDRRTTAEAEINTQSQLMQEAQDRMNAAMDKIKENNPEVEEAIKNDTKLQSLQKELEDLQTEIATKEQELQGIEAKIATKEQEDEAIKEMKADEAQFQFEKNAKDMGAPIDEAREAAENNAAQEKYGKPYEELSDEEKELLEFQINGEVTNELVDWAKDKLVEDPYNPDAIEVMQNGYLCQAKQEEKAYGELNTALEAMPKDLQAGAKTAMEEAVAAAEEAGEDPNAAAMAALANYSNSQIESGELTEEQAAAMQAVGLAADKYGQAQANTVEAYNALLQGDFLQETANLPEPQRTEAIAMRESVMALSPERAAEYQETKELYEKYMMDPHSYRDLSPSAAKDLFGDFGPLVVASYKNEEMQQMIDAELQDGKGAELNNYKAEIFTQGFGDYAAEQAKKATDAHAVETGEDGEAWLANGVGEDATIARNWQSLGADANKAIELTTSDATKNIINDLGYDIVAMYVTGDIEGLNEDLLNRLAQVGEKLGVPVHITSGFRSYEEQERLYQMYLNGTGNLAAKPGTSRHESGLAADCSIGGVNIGAYPGAIDAMKEFGLGLPVGGENWHVEISDSFKGVGQ